MAIWLDVTTSLGWVRPVTGVVRVEVECARAFLANESDQVKFCRFDAQQGAFLAVDCLLVSDNLHRLADLRGRVDRPLRGFAKAVLAQLPDSLQSLLLAPRARSSRRRQAETGLNCLASGDVYISLGCDWDDKDMEVLDRLRRDLGIKVVLCCHDIIPVVRPDLTLGRIASRFERHLRQMVAVADHILCVSIHTQKDLIEFLSSQGSHLKPALSQIRHGSDFPEIASPVAADPEVAALLGQRYVLYVSTLEKRKNHGMLIDAYEDLMLRGVPDLPLLVLVGMAGWGTEHIRKRIERLTQSGAPVRWLSHVADSDLHLLYRHCLMTVYPSLYEGWGLPVAESLAYGKFCLASSAASIPEVGEDLVDYLSPDDGGAWSRVIEHYVLEPDLIAHRENEIQKRYRPPTWSQTARTILGAAKQLESAA